MTELAPLDAAVLPEGVGARFGAGIKGLHLALWLDEGKEFPYIGVQRTAPMITSKLTSKAQTTIPLPVRNALRLGEGDEIAYRIEGDHVILTKADRGPADDPFATFDEWSSEADRLAYADL